MQNNETKLINEVLTNKKKFKRAMIIIISVLVTIFGILFSGFYFGEISKILSLFFGGE